jgi:hypothetical protein
MSLNQTAHIECLACIKKQETSYNNGLNVEAIRNVYFTKVSQLCIQSLRSFYKMLKMNII